MHCLQKLNPVRLSHRHIIPFPVFCSAIELSDLLADLLTENQFLSTNLTGKRALQPKLPKTQHTFEFCHSAINYNLLGLGLRFNSKPKLPIFPHYSLTNSLSTKNTQISRKQYIILIPKVELVDDILV
jgi:hypothetical protein